MLVVAVPKAGDETAQGLTAEQPVRWPKLLFSMGLEIAVSDLSNLGAKEGTSFEGGIGQRGRCSKRVGSECVSRPA